MDRSPVLLTVVMWRLDTDTVFGGVSAFPTDSTIVTGLRARKKYRGYKARKDWTIDIEEDR